VYPNILGEEKVHLLRFCTKKGEDSRKFVPPFIEFVQDVAGDKQYRLREIARKAKPPANTG
jgi:hypothetical protein